MPQIKYKLPPLYRRFFPDFVELEHPEEKWATCRNCVRCRSPKSPHIGSKCCEYYPHLANYLVGGILQDNRPEMAEGQRRIRRVIQRQEGVTPYGILPTRQHKTHLKNGYDAYGNHVDESLESKKALSVALRCPYLHEGDCSIWDYRENLCSTHFCVSTGGSKGHKFWKSTNEYLKMAEDALSCYVLHQLGFPVSHIRARALESQAYDLMDDKGVVDQEDYQTLWADWVGREEELYRRSYEIVASLSQEQFVALCGYNQIILNEAILESLDGFWKNLTPEYLYLNPDIVALPDGAGNVTLTLAEQEIQLNSVVYTVMKKFDGQCTTTEIMDIIASIMLPVSTEIQEMVQKKMLLPALTAKVEVP